MGTPTVSIYLSPRHSRNDARHYFLSGRGSKLTDATLTAENNPANDYPDEELSWDDEEDDAAAIYRKYRHDRSDDEIDWDDSGSEGPGGDRYGRSHVEPDDDSW